MVRRKRVSSKRKAFLPTTIRCRDWLPISLRNKMEYMQQTYFTSVTTPQVYVFRGNGLYDPDQSGTGNQPLGYANLSSIYSRYEAPSSYIRVRWVNNTSVPMMLTVTPTVNSADTNTYNSGQGKPGSRFKYCGGNQERATTVVSNSCTSKLLLGLIPGSGETKALVTGLPGSQWYWSIALTSVDGASALSGVLDVKIIYNTVWYERKVV